MIEFKIEEEERKYNVLCKILNGTPSITLPRRANDSLVHLNDKTICTIHGKVVNWQPISEWGDRVMVDGNIVVEITNFNND